MKALGEKIKWWNYLSEERWVDEASNKEGFLDLILTNKFDILRLVIECKRFDGKWNFLINESENIETLSTTALFGSLNDNLLYWKKNDVHPEMVVSAYCKLENGSQRSDNRTLEDIASDLLIGMEAFAKKETDYCHSLSTANVPMLNKKYYIPIIVTTAKLQKIIFRSKDFDIDKGLLLNGIVEEIPYIKFRKNLSTHVERVDMQSIYQYSDLSRAYDRSVIIVNSKHFEKFITEFELY